MNVLVVGSGGREHVIVWKLKQSQQVDKIYCAPGNGGIACMAECVDIDVTNTKSLVNFARKKKIDLTIVGPELPLTLGIVDEFENNNLVVFGPKKMAAMLEGSKQFAKNFMKKYKIPTAQYEVFENSEDAMQYIQNHEPPFVLKADGLAAGKGVSICNTRTEAYETIEKIMIQKIFGESGNKLVVEEFLQGEEASVLAISDGEHLVCLPASQDHKAVFEGDKGPNTGGMGAYAPAPLVTPSMQKIVEEKILIPTIRGMKEEGCEYTGVLYAGLMITKEGPKVVEFNCRFGDPEIQAVLPLIETDLVDIIQAANNKSLNHLKMKTRPQSAICVIMASGGYPGAYEKDKLIHGLDTVSDDIIVFHAGTRLKNGQIFTNGGRVLGVTAVKNTLSEASDSAYTAVGNITFDKAYYRKDIAYKALKNN